MAFIPFKKMQERVDVDLADSDSSFFWALMYYGEFLTKVTVAALVSAVKEERDRHRYRLIHCLVRADSIGDWNQALDDLLIGPASQYIDHLARDHKRQLTRNVSTFLRHLQVEISGVLVRFASSISWRRGPAPTPPGFFKAWQGCAVADAVVC